jgi:hypothetical protein
MFEPRRMAELQYSEREHHIELVVPHGTRFKELADLTPKLFGDMLARLPRGCPQCKSGDHFSVREKMEHVLRIDLDADKTAELQYSPADRRIELLVPHGTTFKELAQLTPKPFGDMLAKLPRGCPACKSGDDFFIREKMEHVLRIDLDAAK